MARWHRWVAMVLGAVLLGWGSMGCHASTAEDDSEDSGADIIEVRLTLELVASGLDGPLAVTHAGDARLFIVESPGRLRIWRGGELMAQPFLDITPQVRSGGEQGFLSVAFHPHYHVPEAPGQGMFWVNYTNLDGDTVIARYTVSSEDPDRAAPASEHILPDNSRLLKVP